MVMDDTYFHSFWTRKAGNVLEAWTRLAATDERWCARFLQREPESDQNSGVGGIRDACGSVRHIQYCQMNYFSACMPGIADILYGVVLSLTKDDITLCQ